MKIDLKEGKKKIYLFLLSELGMAVLGAFIVFLIYIKVLPSDHFEFKFESYNNFASARVDWLYVFITLSFLNIILFYLLRKFDPNKSYYICPLCEDTQRINKKQDVVLCKKCGQTMVPLKGYYDKDKTKEG